MSSWVLLLAALAACVRFAHAEGDPLPPSLVDLVRNSPISSIQDLQLLLEPDSVDEVPDGQRHHANSTSKRFPRSLAAEQAQQALCKVRTEVMEVTRDMLDRRNANFLLWPPCVEVQRCSGCCNSRALQCIPTVTRTRNLQVLKIQYINKRSHYEKVVISVQDHVECRQQSTAPPAAPRTTANKPQNAPQPNRPAPKSPPLKTPSKEELHRHDELKRNQNPRLDEGDRRQSLWQASRTQSPSVAGTTQRLPLQDPQARGDIWLGGAGREEALPTQETHSARGADGVEQGGGLGHRGEQSNATTPERPTTGEGEGTHRAQVESHLQRTGAPHGHTDHDRNRSQHNHDCKHDRTKATEQSEKPEDEEEGQLPQLDLRREKDGLLTSQRKLDQEKEQVKLQHEEEQQRHNPHHHHQDNHHQHVSHQAHMHTTTQRPATAAPTTTRRPPTQRPPARHHPFQRRLRKNRRRMSKAAMRALLM